MAMDGGLFAGMEVAPIVNQSETEKESTTGEEEYVPPKL